MPKKFLNSVELAGGISITTGTIANGRVLTSDGSGNATWQPASGSSAYTIVPVTTTSSSPAQTSGEIIILVDCATAGGNVTINLPTAVSNTAKFVIKKIDSSSYTVTVDGNGSQTIDGDLTMSLRGKGSMTLISNNANWYII